MKNNNHNAYEANNKFSDVPRDYRYAESHGYNSNNEYVNTNTYSNDYTMRNIAQIQSNSKDQSLTDNYKNYSPLPEKNKYEELWKIQNGISNNSNNNNLVANSDLHNNNFDNKIKELYNNNINSSNSINSNNNPAQNQYNNQQQEISNLNYPNINMGNKHADSDHEEKYSQISKAASFKTFIVELIN